MNMKRKEPGIVVGVSNRHVHLSRGTSICCSARVTS